MSAYLWMLVGLVASAIYPWLVKMYRLQHWIKWDWRYLRARMLGVLIVLVILPLLMSNLDAVSSWDWQKAWLAGYSLSEIFAKLDEGRPRATGWVKKKLNGG